MMTPSGIGVTSSSGYIVQVGLNVSLGDFSYCKFISLVQKGNQPSFYIKLVCFNSALREPLLTLKITQKPVQLASQIVLLLDTSITKYHFVNIRGCSFEDSTVRRRVVELVRSSGFISRNPKDREVFMKRVPNGIDKGFVKC